jgi:hypothetical protein
MGTQGLDNLNEIRPSFVYKGAMIYFLLHCGMSTDDLKPGKHFALLLGA